MDYRYRPQGVCAREITFEVENDVVKNVRFDGGCHGNAQGLAALLEGMSVDEAIRRLSGIRCGWKTTSCPDQLAQALRKTQPITNREAAV